MFKGLLELRGNLWERGRPLLKQEVKWLSSATEGRLGKWGYRFAIASLYRSHHPFISDVFHRGFAGVSNTRANGLDWKYHFGQFGATDILPVMVIV